LLIVQSKQIDERRAQPVQHRHLAHPVAHHCVLALPAKRVADCIHVLAKREVHLLNLDFGFGLHGCPARQLVHVVEAGVGPEATVLLGLLPHPHVVLPGFLVHLVHLLAISVAVHHRLAGAHVLVIRLGLGVEWLGHLRDLGLRQDSLAPQLVVPDGCLDGRHKLVRLGGHDAAGYRQRHDAHHPDAGFADQHHQHTAD
jgi:hypothetical protein